MAQKRITRILRLITEIAGVLGFVVLTMTGKHQLWMALFGISTLLAIFLGRFYCSWICPMNTAFRGISLVYGKLKIPRFKTPSFLKNKLIRWAVLVLFFGSLAVQKKLKIEVNMLLFLTLFSIFLTFIFDEELWHRRLCPFGTILSFASRPARYSLTITEDECISCGKCQKVCPVSSIETLENRKRRNISYECLLCGRCTEVCPADVCRLGFNNEEEKKKEMS